PFTKVETINLVFGMDDEQAVQIVRTDTGEYVINYSMEVVNSSWESDTYTVEGMYKYPLDIQLAIAFLSVNKIKYAMSASLVDFEPDVGLLIDELYPLFKELNIENTVFLESFFENVGEELSFEDAKHLEEHLED